MVSDNDNFKAAIHSASAIAAFSIALKYLRLRKFGGATLAEWHAAIPEAKKIELANKEYAKHEAKR